MRKRGKVDSNQQEIVYALRSMGATVQSLAAIGSGCPDLLVGWRGHTLLIEIKRPKGQLTDDQRDWFEDWRGGTVHVVHSIEELLKALGL